MTYTKKFQQLADAAIERVAVVMPEDLDAILAAGGVIKKFVPLEGNLDDAFFALLDKQRLVAN
jgi:hypothetical protein